MEVKSIKRYIYIWCLVLFSKYAIKTIAVYKMVHKNLWNSSTSFDERRENFVGTYVPNYDTKSDEKSEMIIMLI